MQNANEDFKLVQVLAATATGTTAVNTTAVDITGFENVVFIGSVGTGNAGNSVKAQQGSLSDGSDGVDLAGSATVLNSKTQFAVDVQKASKQYLRLVFTRSGATTTVDPVWAILYNSRDKVPVTQPTALTVKRLTNAYEGTA